MGDDREGSSMGEWMDGRREKLVRRGGKGERRTVGFEV